MIDLAALLAVIAWAGSAEGKQGGDRGLSGAVGTFSEPLETWRPRSELNLEKGT
jgi:hypothetical protein